MSDLNELNSAEIDTVSGGETVVDRAIDSLNDLIDRILDLFR